MVKASFGQQKPHYTQYLFNQFIINPALTGIENYTDIELSHRRQWVGFQDAPVTSYFTIHTPIKKRDNRTTPTSFTSNSKNPRNSDFWDEYTASAPHHGVGMQIINDVTGPINRFSANLSYAYHVGLTYKTSLSAGFGVGVNNISINANKLIFGDITIDPSVYGSGQIDNIKPDMNAGLFLYSADYFVGFSALQIIPEKIEFADGLVNTVQGKQVPHFFMSAGYRLSAGDDFNLTPSILLKYINPTPIQLDINAKLQYRDLLWLGAGLRIKEGFSGLVGVNIAHAVHVSYAYDFSTSEINNFSKGTHEILLGFVLGKSGDTCPRNNW